MVKKWVYFVTHVLVVQVAKIHNFSTSNILDKFSLLLSWQSSMCFPSTRCIIDCTELFCQRPSSLAIQSSLYSSFKHYVTYKALIGIAPSGAITFVGQLFDGSISDKEIIKRSGILNSLLWDEGDSLMADRGFTISEDLKPLKVQLNIPAFLGRRDQLSEEEVLNSKTIASVRIHVERAIERVKKFKLFINKIPLVLHG